MADSSSSTGMAPLLTTMAPLIIPEPQTNASSSTAAPEACAQCNKSDASLKPCNKCHTTPYCGKECQKAHFKSHKKVCASLAQEYVKNNEPKMASRAAPKSSDRNTGFKKWEFDT